MFFLIILSCVILGIQSCPPYQFHCGDWQCIRIEWVCDNEKDCANGVDEVNCHEESTTNFITESFTETTVNDEETTLNDEETTVNDEETTVNDEETTEDGAIILETIIDKLITQETTTDMTILETEELRTQETTTNMTILETEELTTQETTTDMTILETEELTTQEITKDSILITQQTRRYTTQSIEDNHLIIVDAFRKLCGEVYCHNGGSCAIMNSDTYCRCKDGYQGRYCETQLSTPQHHTLSWIIALNMGVLIIVLVILIFGCRANRNVRRIIVHFEKSPAKQENVYAVLNKSFADV